MPAPKVAPRKTTMRALLIVAGLAASGSAVAQSADFAALDRNRDGYLSRFEAMADPEISKRFALFDTDRDQRLSEAEYRAAREDNDLRALRDTALTARVKAALIAERGIPSMSISV